MNIITALLLGILIGWVIEWVIDWVYWRRRQRELAERTSDAEAKVGNLQADIEYLKSRAAALEAEASQFEGVKGELESKIASLETQVNGLEVVNGQLEAVRNQQQAKIAELESQASGLGRAGVAAEAGVAAVAGVAAAVGATRLFDAAGEAGEEPGAEAAAMEAVTETFPVPAEGAIAGSLPVSEAEFTGNVEATDFAEMAKFKYPLEYVEGIGPIFAEKLKAIGLVSCLDFLKAGATRKGREEIVEKSGISSRLILKWVNHIDLYRIKGVGSEYADLLEAAGVDTVIELAQRNPANLFGKMNELNAARELVRKPPTAAQVEDWTAQAKSLPRVVSY